MRLYIANHYQVIINSENNEMFYKQGVHLDETIFYTQQMKNIKYKKMALMLCYIINIIYH